MSDLPRLPIAPEITRPADHDTPRGHVADLFGDAADSGGPMTALTRPADQVDRGGTGQQLARPAGTGDQADQAPGTLPATIIASLLQRLRQAELRQAQAAAELEGARAAVAALLGAHQASLAGRELIPRREAARRLGVSPTWVLKCASAGRLSLFIPCPACGGTVEARIATCPCGQTIAGQVDTRRGQVDWRLVEHELAASADPGRDYVRERWARHRKKAAAGVQADGA